jgi:hypothetical protein
VAWAGTGPGSGTYPRLVVADRPGHLPRAGLGLVLGPGTCPRPGWASCSAPARRPSSPACIGWIQATAGPRAFRSNLHQMNTSDQRASTAVAFLHLMNGDRRDRPLRADLLRRMQERRRPRCPGGRQHSSDAGPSSDRVQSATPARCRPVRRSVQSTTRPDADRSCVARPGLMGNRADVKRIRAGPRHCLRAAAPHEVLEGPRCS